MILDLCQHCFSKLPDIIYFTMEILFETKLARLLRQTDPKTNILEKENFPWFMQNIMILFSGIYYIWNIFDDDHFQKSYDIFKIVIITVRWAIHNWEVNKKNSEKLSETNWNMTKSVDEWIWKSYYIFS